MDVIFKRLSEVDKSDIIDLMNNPRVRRYMPMASGNFGPAECHEFIASKERFWEECGYGPWAFIIDGEFVGWGGLQPEGGEVDLALVLHPKHWGIGRSLYKEIVSFAFGSRGLKSVTILLPPTRTRVRGIMLFGFQRDGEVEIAGERFIRYRLNAREDA